MNGPHAFLGLVTLWILLAMAPSGLADGAVVGTPPNIVIFLADDLTWHDVGGPTDARTPHLDALAAQGQRLTGCFSPSPVCSPSRQALLTGLFPVRNGAHPNHSRVKPGTKSLPHYLATLGYRTACSGKRHFGPPASYPFDAFIGADAAAGVAKLGLEGGGLDLPGAEAFITKSDARPFFLYLASHDPHSPWGSVEQSTYQPDSLHLPPYLVDTPETRSALAAYLEEVSRLDRQVGEALAMLERTGHANDTLFIFASEQGSSFPFAKWTCYDAGIKATVLVRWPGKVATGSINPVLMQYVDIAPTLIQAAGGSPDLIDTGCPDSNGARSFDGTSMLAGWLGKPVVGREAIFSVHTARGIAKGPPAYGTRAVRDLHWKFIWNLEPEGRFSNALTDMPLFISWQRKGLTDVFARNRAESYVSRPKFELYDLAADPWELNNVAGRADLTATESRLRGMLESWMRQQGDQGHATEIGVDPGKSGE